MIVEEETLSSSVVLASSVGDISMRLECSANARSRKTKRIIEGLMKASFSFCRRSRTEMRSL